MRYLRAFFRRLLGLLPNQRRERELHEEIECNLQLHIDENLRTGMTQEEARRAALIKFGGVEVTKEAYRDRATLPYLENLGRDLQFALRQLLKNPGFTATAVSMLALGVCASVAIFAFVDAALIRPLPYRDPARLVGVYEKLDKVCPLCNLSYPDYLDWKRWNTVFSSFDVYNHQGMIRSTPSGSQRAFTTRVTDGFFRTLGVTPILGRDFHPGEDLVSAPRTAILSYSTWQSNYGGDSNILGKSVILDGNSNLIIGVLPRQFHFAPSGPTEYWLTMHASSECDLRRSCHSLFGVARLKDGVTFQAALADVTGIANRLQKLYPGSNQEQGANLSPLSDVIVGDIRPILLVLLSGACLLLIIAAVNVSSLLLVRTESRLREFAIRASLGASRIRITSQFVAEGLVLVALGTVLGLALAYWAIRLLGALLSEDMLLNMPFLNGLSLNPPSIAFGLIVGLLAAFQFSLTPALRLSWSEMRQGLSEGSRGSSGNVWRRLGSKLVVIELATAVVLLSGAGLLGQSLYRLLAVHIGFQPDHLVRVDLAASQKSYANDPQLIALERRVINTVSRLPGVTSVGVSSKSPVSFSGNTTWFRIVGRPWHGEHNDTPFIEVSANYFKTIGAQLIKGRYFEESEDGSKPSVAIVNQTFARQYFPGEDAVGKQITPLGNTPKPIEIVGVVADIREASLDSDNRASIYFPFNQSTENYFCVFARTSSSEAIIPAITKAIHNIDPNLVTRGETMAEQISNSQATYIHRTLALLVGGFAAMALLLGVTGLYGVIAYSVGQRTREIGVRMALGAQRNSVYRLILQDAGGLVGAGVIIGLACSVGAAALMRKLLFGVSSWDVPTLAAVTLTLAVFALLASFIPARRATLVNPMEALRTE